MQRLVVHIGYSDRTVTYPVTPKIQIDFERFYKKNLITMDNDGITGRYQLAFEVQKVHKEDMPAGVMPTFEDWCEQITAIETDGEDVVPFGPAASANGSSSLALPAGSPTTNS